MTRAVLSDLAVLRRRVVALAAGLLVVVTAMTVWISRRSAGRQLQVITDGLRQSGLDPSAGACAVTSASTDRIGCAASAPSGSDPVFVRSLLDYHPAVVEAAGLTSTPAGLVLFAARQSATMVGLVALVLVVTLHLTGLWESGAARFLVPRVGLARMVLVRSTTAAIVALVVPVVAVIGAAVGALLPTGGPPLPDAVVPIAAPVGTLLRAWAVLLLVAVLAVGISLGVRALVGAFLVTVGILALGFFGTLDPDLYPWSPAGWIATWLRLPRGEYRQVVDYLWVPAASGVSAATSVAALALVCGVAAAVGVLVLRRVRPLA